MVMWLCGLSGSGKTTLGRLLYQRLKPKTPHLVLLDGEDIRAVCSDDLGHDSDARRRNSIRIARLCQLLDRQGIHVICCAMTIAEDAQRENREKIAEYREVFINVPIHVLAERDPKGIYRRARAGELRNVCGVDIPYTPPAAPHLTIDNGQPLTDLAPLIDRILSSASFEYAV
jgi:adenylylsulfate kinase